VTKDHFLGFNALDGIEFGKKVLTLFFFSDHLKDQQAVGGAGLFIDFMKAQAGLDMASVFAQKLLDVRNMFDPFRNVNPENNVIFHGFLPLKMLLFPSFKVNGAL
jgi:hypothetical protein